MKYIPIGIFLAGAAILAMHMLQKLSNSFSSFEAVDAIALLVLAGVAHFLFSQSAPHEHQG